ASCNLANILNRCGLRVYYLALIPEKPFYDLDKEVIYFEPQSFNFKKINIFKTLQFIRSYIKFREPDYIISLTKFYSALTNFALYFTKDKIVISERSSPFYKWPLHINIFCKLSFLFKHPCGVISQTKLASKYHKKNYPGTPNLIMPNIVRQVDKYPHLL